jgi:hypothetical protein
VGLTRELDTLLDTDELVLAPQHSSSWRWGFARDDALDDAPARSFATFDRESHPRQVVHWIAEQVIVRETVHKWRERHLAKPHKQHRAARVLEQQQAPTWSQDTQSLRDCRAFVGDLAQRERADDAVEGIVSVRQTLCVGLLERSSKPERLGSMRRNVEHRRAQVNGRELNSRRVVRQVQSGANRDLEGLAAGTAADAGPPILEKHPVEGAHPAVVVRRGLVVEAPHALRSCGCHQRGGYMSAYRAMSSRVRAPGETSGGRTSSATVVRARRTLPSHSPSRADARLARTTAGTLVTTLTSADVASNIGTLMNMLAYGISTASSTPA